MGSPPEATGKRLYGISGNRCAFPNCQDTVVDRSSGTVTGRICHIKALSAKGPRFDPNQTEAERHGFENLVLMCAKHHDVIDAEPADADEVVAKLIYNLNAEIRDNTVSNGSSLNVQGQSGAQVAHSITNVNAAPKWILSTTGVLTLGGLGYGALHAPDPTFIFNTNQQGGQVAQSIVNVGRQARKVYPAAAQDLAARLRSLPAVPFGIDVQSGDGECFHFASALAAALTSGGWQNLGTTQVVDSSPLPAFEFHTPGADSRVELLHKWATETGFAPKLIVSGCESYVLIRIGPDL